MSHAAPTDTPNVVIESPSIRKGIGAALYAVSLLAGIATLVTASFPELTTGAIDPNRIITLVNAIISLLAGSFGFAVTLPNVPKGVVGIDGGFRNSK